MKNTILKISALLVFLSIISCDEKEEPANDNPYASFRSYFNCYINGEYFESKGKFGCHKNRVTYYLDDYFNDKAGFFQTSGRNCIAELNEPNMVGFSMGELLEPETIDLFANERIRNVYVGGVYDSIIKDRIYYNQVISGQLHIEKLVPHVPGERVGVVIGTFEFILHNGEGDTARVSNGKFGMALPTP